MGDYDHGKMKLAVFGALFLTALGFGIFLPDSLIRFFTHPLVISIKVYHIFWLGAVTALIRRLIPRLNRKTSSGKVFLRNYVPGENMPSSRNQKLLAYTHKVNRGAVKSALYWTLVIVGTGLAFAGGLLNRLWLFEMVIFFIFMDQFCVTVWCPFKWLIRNKCCKTCRINNWGYLMAFSPLLWVPNFWTYSVLLLSGAIVVQWEILFHKHPERFYEGYNAVLSCKGCKDDCTNRAGRSDAA